MTVSGHVEGGVVVLEEGCALPEGTKVRIDVVVDAAVLDDEGRTLGEKLMRHAGRADGLPSDLSVNHDRYLYDSGSE
jgi:hypothetical protein